VLNRTAAALLSREGLALPDSPWVVLVGYEDNELAVNWQIQQLIRELTPALSAVQAQAGAVVDPLWQQITDFALWPESRLTMQANLLPARVSAFCLAADRLPERPPLHAHAGSGIIRVLMAGETSVERAAEVVSALTALTGDEGNLVLPRCPTEWKARLPVWGKPRGDAWLMRQVREKFDPRRVFNPGRMF
jgi:glycolate oxidase FAD binding subunit